MKKRTKKPLTAEEELLKDYKRKLMGEAFMKSLLAGVACGFLVSVPVSAVAFITAYNMLWIALAVFAAASAGVTALSYFRYYRTNIRQTALRVDGVGLEERVVTMIEYAGKDDALARRQREDTRNALRYVEPAQVKIPFPKTAFAVLVAAALLGICMMVTSTVYVVRANEPTVGSDPPPAGAAEETEEEKIIREMIEDLRRIIAEANVKAEIKDALNGMVDDLEASLRPEDSTEVKIAKISETAQKIHKILKDELSKTTIADELQKHDTTKALGAAIESEDLQKIEQAFGDMYASIAPLVGAEKYDVLIQTANDILQSLEDATVEPDDGLAKALEDLAQAMLDAIPPPSDLGGDEDKISDDINQSLEDAMQSAMDAVKDALEDQKEIEGTDEAIQDAMKDAMEQLGQEGGSETDDDQKEDPSQGEDGEDESDETGPAHPTEDGEIVYDAVIDGETPYMDVYSDYYEWAIELLTSGTLSESERKIIENYFNILN